MQRNIGSIGLASLAAMGVTFAGHGQDLLREAAPAAPPPQRRSYRRAKFNGSIAEANRWTGRPHEHRREIARRVRQRGEG